MYSCYNKMYMFIEVEFFETLIAITYRDRKIIWYIIVILIGNINFIIKYSRIMNIIWITHIFCINSQYYCINLIGFNNGEIIICVIFSTVSLLSSLLFCFLMGITMAISSSFPKLFTIFDWTFFSNPVYKFFLGHWKTFSICIQSLLKFDFASSSWNILCWRFQSCSGKDMMVEWGKMKHE